MPNYWDHFRYNRHYFKRFDLTCSEQIIKLFFILALGQEAFFIFGSTFMDLGAISLVKHLNA